MNNTICAASRERADKLDAAAWGGLPAGHTIGEPAPLFPRKEA